MRQKPQLLRIAFIESRGTLFDRLTDLVEEKLSGQFLNRFPHAERIPSFLCASDPRSDYDIPLFFHILLICMASAEIGVIQ